jgi:hypothetical protein
LEYRGESGRLRSLMPAPWPDILQHLDVAPSESRILCLAGRACPRHGDRPGHPHGEATRVREGFWNTAASLADCGAWRPRPGRTSCNAWTCACRIRMPYPMPRRTCVPATWRSSRAPARGAPTGLPHRARTAGRTVQAPVGTILGTRTVRQPAFGRVFGIPRRAWPTAEPDARALAGHPATPGRALAASESRILCLHTKTCPRKRHQERSLP